jgi:phosphate:Na+ symporter
MSDTILLVLSLLGGIALGLYGMKVMSQGLLQLSGSRVRATLRNLSQHRFPCFGVGAEVTVLVQSSAATTLMAVTSVNAGLMTLRQSVAMIMGANVGTTLTPWMVALLGYAFPAGFLAIPLIVFALPFTYSSRIKSKPWSSILMGASMMLYGFCTFVQMMPVNDGTTYPEIAEALSLLASAGFWSVLLFLVIGIATTMLFQSSVATITLAMAACATGWVPFVMAAALVIGDNVGTTLIPLIAARKTNVQARRAAFAHLFFNLVGLVWALALIYPMSHWISGIVGGRATGLAFGVALCHTCFNLVTALLTIGFLSYFCVMLCKFFPVHNDDDEEFHLSFIEGSVQSAAELSVDQARKETVQFGLRCQRMLDLTDQFVHMPKTDANYNHLFSRIEKYEKITDRLELEIDRYLNNLDKSQLSPRALARVRSIFQMADELESLADACYKVARSVVRRHEVNVEFIDMQQQNINQMLALTHQSMDLMMQLLRKNDLTAADMNRAYNQEDQVNGLRNQFRDQNIGNVQSGSYTYQSGVLYMEIVSGCEKICDYIINVVEALATQNDIPARDGE